MGESKIINPKGLDVIE